MPILGVPDVIVRETVDVDVKAIGVHVDVGNEEMCDRSSVPPSDEYSTDCILLGTLKSSDMPHQLTLFLFMKDIPTLPQDVSGETLENIFMQSPAEALTAARA